MDKMSAMSEKWKINKVHFRDLDLEAISQRKAYVLNEIHRPVLVPFVHLFKLRDHLFIVHETLNAIHMENATSITVSHLRTGQKLLDIVVAGGEKFDAEKVQAKAKDFIDNEVARLSERYVMERLKSNQAINVKYNGNGFN
jgi:hypothetical protein